MELNNNLYKLKGRVMHYAWGGHEFIPDLLGINNESRQPFAEYWMGAHPLAPSELLTPEGPVSLYTAIQEEPGRIISEKVYDAFGRLPYLFKVQDVKNILSIQVHPGKEEAEKGFDREETAGIPLNAPYRNYRDRNHKPEMLVALTEFWLLHGFRQLAEIEQILIDVPEFTVLLPYYRREGLKPLYQFIMEIEQPEINALLENLIKRNIRMKKEGELTREMPGWWIAKIFEGKEGMGDIDRAIFSIYFFNIVNLKPGEGLFQGAGMPHAYLEGQCIELMANSDNVLRAGLTPKHIDVPELMKHILFETVVPNIMKGITVLTGEKIYPCPVPDFGIAKIELTANLAYTTTTTSLEILLVTEGGAVVNNSIVLKRGEAVAVFAGETYTLQASGDTVLFKAFVPA
ncbi:MAG: mannose-6-phosphate isomerase, class I [Chitinophagaceae bacterium]|nr:mannose-6-phosphate isomerase, class I [Chitinophagaceae bacterium]MDP1765058.1 mannose-6-phosphate isomerase, class I [Sediminibacterium sp.]MDP1810265.1 mannose-6-phosphate isomerase, class I [Sediminibacterium sp.]MDP3128756.1 mannose-6-phosphate isomerase, class I [Sediminibacterium sp.]MDP3667628.1 mannose-6-phosphate isomerase, class I [Sediminibacterium sp.]